MINHFFKLMPNYPSKQSHTLQWFAWKDALAQHLNNSDLTVWGLGWCLRNATFLNFSVLQCKVNGYPLQFSNACHLFQSKVEQKECQSLKSTTVIVAQPLNLLHTVTLTAGEGVGLVEVQLAERVGVHSELFLVSFVFPFVVELPFLQAILYVRPIHLWTWVTTRGHNTMALSKTKEDVFE